MDENIKITSAKEMAARSERARAEKLAVIEYEAAYAFENALIEIENFPSFTIFATQIVP